MAAAGSVVERLVAATNAHDLDALVMCFAEDYVNKTPVHPSRSFVGREQIRRNWTAIFAGVPDITVRVVASAATPAEVWTEWVMTGTRADGAPHAMAGVIIFGIGEDCISSARFYLEPVDPTGEDVTTAIAQQLGSRT